MKAAKKCPPMKKALRTREHLILENTKEREMMPKSGMAKAKLSCQTATYMRENIHMERGMAKELTSKKTVSVLFIFLFQSKW